MPWRTPSRPWVMVIACSPLVAERPPGSTPTSATSASSRNAVNAPIALEPPPTAATTALGSAPNRSWNWARASRPTTDWKSRIIVGNGCGPTTEPIANRYFSGSAAYTSNAESTASFRERPSRSTETTFVPSRRMRTTLGCCLATSIAPMWISQSRPTIAAAVARATPCWPAPVSAIRLRLPMRLASSASPIVWLILWAPVWFRSSRLSTIRAPPSSSERRSSGVRGEGRPTASRSRRRYSA